MSKPLVWELVKDSQRFQFLSADRVEHVVVNMNVVQEGEEGIWWVIILRFADCPYRLIRTFENYQWTKAVETVIALIREKNILGEEDILIMGHLDELLSRKSVYLGEGPFTSPLLLNGLSTHPHSL